MVKKTIFAMAFFLFAAAVGFSITQAELEEFQESWNSQKNEFAKADVMHCVGNEDNSLFLMVANNIDGGHSVVWAYHAGELNIDNKIKPVWDRSTVSTDTIKSLVFSPFSNKFYFVSAWADDDSAEKGTQGLYIASQAYDQNNSYIAVTHNQMEIGEGHLAVNKTGVWLLHDTSANGMSLNQSLLYKIEDSDGKYIFNPEKTLTGNSFLSFYNYYYKENKDKSIRTKHLWEGVFQNTDYTLLLCDKDTTSWWLFDCVTEKLTKYESYWDAKRKAIRIDKRYEIGLFPLFEKAKPWQLVLQILGVVCLILVVGFLILLIIQKIRKAKLAAAALKERNRMIFDIQEKERAKISRDIHDSVVQDIRVLRLETENLVVDEASRPRQTKIADLATDCIIKLRNICYNLAPAELTSHNEGDSAKVELISIINSLVQQFSARTHIPCVFKVEEGFEYPVLEKEKTQNLFRVIHEALTNIEKHSYATQASIFMKKDGGSLLIYVTDDGIGCNPNELDKKLKSKEHLGLRSMKDRMDFIGGSIEFFTSQSDGMEIKIELPLEEAGS